MSSINDAYYGTNKTSFCLTLSPMSNSSMSPCVLEVGRLDFDSGFPLLASVCVGPLFVHSLHDAIKPCLGVGLIRHPGGLRMMFFVCLDNLLKGLSKWVGGFVMDFSFVHRLVPLKLQASLLILFMSRSYSFSCRWQVLFPVHINIFFFSLSFVESVYVSLLPLVWGVLRFSIVFNLVLVISNTIFFFFFFLGGGGLLWLTAGRRSALFPSFSKVSSVTDPQISWDCWEVF